MLVVISWHIIGSLLWKAPIVDPYEELRQLQYETLLSEQSTRVYIKVRLCWLAHLLSEIFVSRARLKDVQLILNHYLRILER